ncbi:hypothetical protein CTA2_7778 [Colletotrichum tanaceti]|uniref:Uncharacterized protein n=1 Tax=Colletotrichum tanaceti TaxID=1306861 RepID=A0A4U6X1I3_9PEZI|nr:hypothetical protein CTA2_7778 [Colletotrichum tanaceti]TKW48864.1 hypothetical protein CTA1_11170 [Colletotrichum tanaceti]
MLPHPHEKAGWHIVDARGAKGSQRERGCRAPSCGGTEVFCHSLPVSQSFIFKMQYPTFGQFLLASILAAHGAHSLSLLSTGEVARRYVAPALALAMPALAAPHVANIETREPHHTGLKTNGKKTPAKITEANNDKKNNDEKNNTKRDELAVEARGLEARHHTGLKTNGKKTPAKTTEANNDKKNNDEKNNTKRDELAVETRGLEARHHSGLKTNDKKTPAKTTEAKTTEANNDKKNNDEKNNTKRDELAVEDHEGMEARDFTA